MTFPSVAIVLVNWNGKNDTLECLQSLRGMHYPNFAVILVDNGSTDGSVELFRGVPQVDFLENGENLGIARANNVGIARARERGFDYVMLLNNDTVVAPDMLSQLVETCRVDPAIGVVGPKMYYHEAPDVIWFAGGVIHRWKGDTTHVGFQEEDVGQHDCVTETDYITSCCLLAPMTLFTKLGDMDPYYFIYFDETDFCMRAAQMGRKIVYVPHAKLWHKVSRTMGSGSARYWFHYMRGRARFVGKLLPWPNRFASYAWMLLVDLPRMAFHFVRCGEFDRIPAFAQGLWQGVRGK